MQNEIEVFNLFETEMDRCRLLYMQFNTAPVAGKRYYINKISKREDCAFVQEQIIRGIELYYYSVAALNFTPTIQLDGNTFNVIRFADIARVLVTLAKTQRDVKIYKSPMASLAHGIQFETRRYKLDIDFGQSFIEFTDVAFTTPFPMVIPFVCSWNEDKL